MLALCCMKAVALAFGLLPSAPGEQFRKLPTPEAVQQEIIDRLLTNYKRSLATMREAIKKIEEEPDPRVRAAKATLLKRFKELEADDLRRIESLEKGMLNPSSPVLPVAPKEGAKPKPPIRD